MVLGPLAPGGDAGGVRAVPGAAAALHGLRGTPGFFELLGPDPVLVLEGPELVVCTAGGSGVVAGFLFPGGKTGREDPAFQLAVGQGAVAAVRPVTGRLRTFRHGGFPGHVEGFFGLPAEAGQLVVGEPCQGPFPCVDKDFRGF